MEEEISEIERKQLENNAKLTAFSIGAYTVLFDFTKCFEICKRRHENCDVDNLTPSFHILQEAERKIKSFCLQLKTMGHTNRYFYVISSRYLFLDIKDVFCSIFFIVEGTLDLSLSFNEFSFRKRIEELNLNHPRQEDIKKLTTIRDKLVHVSGYSKPKPNKKNDPRLSDLIKNGIQGIKFNKDPDKPLILEDDINNVQVWVKLIEILLDIVSSISY